MPYQFIREEMEMVIPFFFPYAINPSWQVFLLVYAPSGSRKYSVTGTADNRDDVLQHPQAEFGIPFFPRTRIYANRTAGTERIPGAGSAPFNVI